MFLTAKEAVQQGLMYVSESKEAFPQCNALISSVPVQFVSKSKKIFPQCDALVITIPVKSVSNSKEILQHCNALTHALSMIDSS